MVTFASFLPDIPRCSLPTVALLRLSVFRRGPGLPFFGRVADQFVGVKQKKVCRQ